MAPPHSPSHLLIRTALVLQFNYYSSSFKVPCVCFESPCSIFFLGRRMRWHDAYNPDANELA